MTRGIPFDNERRKIIKEHLKKQEEDAGGKDKLRSAKLTLKGVTKLEPIYQFDLDDLSFNKVNGRIKSEVFEKEIELGHELSNYDSQDQAIIRDILLSIRRDENDKIKEDLKENTQLYPGIITCDGIVINGNRRKALFYELHHDTHDSKYQYLDVHVLPSDITRPELWLIEAGIQLSAPQQLDYSPINHLLKLREGIDSNLSVKQMASRIYGVSEKQLEDDLKRLNLIEEYLKDFLGKEDKYFLVKNLNEHFINLCNILDWTRNPRGKRRDWTPDEDDINELKLIGFYYIRMKMPHLRIRDLRDIFALSNSWQELKRALDVDPNLTKEDLARIDITSVSEEELEDEYYETEENDSHISSTDDQDLKEEVLWRDIHTKKLKSIFEDAKEQQKITLDSEKPLNLAKRALKIVQAIPQDTDKLNDDNLDGIFRDIIQIVNTLRKILNKKRN